MPISTVSFGTPDGTISSDGRQQSVPVDDEMLKRIAQLCGGSSHTASSLQQLKDVFATLQQQIGYESIKGDASAGWLRLGAVALVLAAVAGMRIHTRLPR
jgi:Ca-activated chloride channel family protein